MLHRTWDSKGQFPKVHGIPKLTILFLVGQFTSDASVRDGMRGHVQRLVEQYQQIEHRIASDNEASAMYCNTH